MITILRDVFL